VYAEFATPTDNPNGIHTLEAPTFTGPYRPSGEPGDYESPHPRQGFMSLHRALYGELFTVIVVVSDWEHDELFVAVRRRMAEQERTGLLMEAALTPARVAGVFEQRGVKET
jgi:hypothetical protein